MGTVFFLRKVRSFNKSSYSSNSQLASVIFYFGLYINLLVIYGSFSMLYGFVFKLNYTVWVLYFLIGCFIVPSALRISKRFIIN